MTTISSGSDVIYPTIVLGYSSQRASGNRVHQILGRTNPDVTLRPSEYRVGTIDLGFAGPMAEENSKEAEALHSTGGVFVMLDDDRSTVQMTYVVQEGGRVTRTLDSETRDAWVVSIDFQEVSS